MRPRAEYVRELQRARYAVWCAIHGLVHPGRDPLTGLAWYGRDDIALSRRLYIERARHHLEVARGMVRRNPRDVLCIP